MANTTPKPFVFVLMPFDASFGDVYQLGIKPAAEGAGAYCERIDDQIFVESILSRIFNQIAKADLIVADMTGRNPNVFYEVGYAHALGKTVILLTQNSEDIPFDLKDYPHIIDGSSIAGLKDGLGKRIAYHCANPEEKAQPQSAQLIYTIAGTLIAPGVCIGVPIERYLSDSLHLVIGVNNPEENVAERSGSNLSLILPEDFRPEYGGFQLPDKRFLHDLGSVYRLLPGEWGKLRVSLPLPPILLRKSQVIPAELRTFTRSGPLSTAFSLKFIGGVKTGAA